MKQAAFVLFAIFIATSSFCQCTPTTAHSGATFSDDASMGTLTWSNPGNAISKDNNKSTVTALSIFNDYSTHYIMAKNFGFSIPANATVCGIFAEIEKNSAGFSIGGTITDNTVRLMLSGALCGRNAKSSASWPSSEAYTGYGGSDSLWGLTPSPSDINDVNFGIAISVDISSGLGFPSANINHIRLTVYYKINPTVLPVTWTGFTATPLSNSIRLRWTTAAEMYNKFFIVERSGNGYSWKALDTISAKNAAASYEWDDQYPERLNYYRIRQVDIDGQSSLSEVITANYTGINPDKFRVFNSSPDEFTIMSPDKISMINLLDVQGRIQSFRYVTRNDLRQVISTSGLIPGIYIVQVITSSGQHTTKVFKNH